MALIHHWPLDGSAECIATKKTPTTATNTWTTNGKIGRCATFASGQTIVYDNVVIPSNASFTAWAYLTSVTNAMLFSLNTSTGSGPDLYISSGTLCWNVGDGATNPFKKNNVNVAIPSLNTWHHYAVTCDSLTNKATLYLNGEFYGEAIYRNIRQAYNSNRAFTIGNYQKGNTNYYWPGRINDVRIYSHVLSLKEVREIAKCKLLHYTFNAPAESTTNVFPNGSFVSRTTRPFTGMTRGAISIVEDTTAPTSRYALKLVASGDDAYTIPDSGSSSVLSTASAGQTWTFSAWAKGASGGESLELWFFPMNSSNAWVSAHKAKAFTLTNQWVRYEHTYTLPANSSIANLACRIDNNKTGNTIYVNGVQMEQKDHATPFTEGRNRKSTIIDLSDFNNHTQIISNNSPYAMSDSKIGDNSVKFINGNLIKSSKPVSPTDELTISFWMKDLVKGTDITKWITQNQENNTLGNDLGWLFVVGWGTDVYFGPGYSGQTQSNMQMGSINDVYQTGTWNHYVATYSQRTKLKKIYRNGVLVLSKTEASSATMNYNSDGYVRIWKQNSMSALIDDYRVYGTALSDADILDLYKNRCSFDDRGNIWANNRVNDYSANLLDYSSWKTNLAIPPSGWSLNGTSQENGYILMDNPVGDTDYVWGTTWNDTDSNSDGGFNSVFVDINHSAKYRFSVWMRRSDIGNGRAYFGLRATNSYSSVIYTNSGINSFDNNPYFWSGLNADAPRLADEWLLFVSYVYPSTFTGTSLESSAGVYDVRGNKLYSFTNAYKWIGDTTQAQIRAYLFYSTSQNEKQYFYRPRIDLCDGTEVPLGILLKCEEHSPIYKTGSASKILEKSIISSSKLQTGKPVRYIRDYINGSNANTGNHWVEIQAFSKGGVNIAKGKTVTGSVAPSNGTRITDGNIGKRTIPIPSRVYNYTYSGGVQSFTAPWPGSYTIECWGAEGGYRSTSYREGKGGYAKGTLNLNLNQTLYIHVGQSGYENQSTTTQSYGGGGVTSGTARNAGGGASDVRLNSGAWNDASGLLSRIIVAGGGGSSGASAKPGGAGGGTTGISRTESYGTGGAGGTQTEGGAGGSGNSGTFGIGGNGLYRSSGYGGAGGGGWYGGGGVYPDTSGDDDRGGGGGSGYVLTSSSSKPSGYTPSSSFHMSSTVLTAGNASMPNPDGGTMTGRVGNGYVRITFNGIAATANNDYASIAAGLQYVQVDLGTNQFISGINVLHYFDDGRIYNGTKTQVSTDGSSWETVFDSAISGTYAETGVGNFIGLDSKNPVKIKTNEFIATSFKQL